MSADPHVTPGAGHGHSPHEGDGQGNPQVHYDKTDMDPRFVFWSGVAFAVFAGVVPLVIIPVYWFYLREESRGKETELPPAAVDANRLPPEPRLEAIDALRDALDHKYVFLPNRAAEAYAGQEKLLKEGEKGEQGGYLKLPVDTPDSKVGAIQQLADKLPARKDSPPPSSFLRQLPSKASSGRTETGGQ